MKDSRSGHDPGLPPELEDELADAFWRHVSERESRLRSLLAANAEHREELLVRIEALRNDSSSLVAADEHDARDDAGVGRVLDVSPYRLVRRLGSGGMGEVFLAEQSEPIERRVALKLIKRGMDSAAILERFELERRALAAMDHDCIARVLDAGTAESGQPFFVMEWVDGRPITEFCDEERLDVDARLELFQRVCSGVQHAHTKGIIHRDLKPSNILVAVQDGKPVPKIIDFGLARAVDPGPDDARVSLPGQAVGTPEYMSPEQVGAGPLEVDARSDVYSLGVVLYELLVGELPLETEGLRRGRLDELRRRILESEPSPPSRRPQSSVDSAAVAGRRGCSETTLSRRLRGDLDWIVMRALAKDASQRYETPNELAADIRRHLEHEPVVAGPPSRTYRMRKLARRYRGQLAAAAAILLVALAGAGVAWRYAMSARRALGRAELAQRQSEARERETRALSDFHSRILMDLTGNASGVRSSDAAPLDELGAALAEWLRVEVREGHRRAGGSPDAVERAVASFDGIVASTNMMNVARAAFTEVIFEPAIRAVESEYAEHPRIRAALQTALSVPLHYAGLDRLAEPLARAAARTRSAVLGEDDPDTWTSMASLGVVLMALGELDEGGELLRTVMNRREERFGPNHRATLIAVNNVAAWELERGQFESAAVLLRQVVQSRRAQLGAGHPEVVSALGNLALSLHRAGRIDEARAAYDDCVQEQALSIGASHPLALLNRHHRSILMAEEGQYSDAQVEMERVLADMRARFGDAHVRTLNCLATLARVRRERGDLGEAERLGRRALSGLRAQLGMGHARAVIVGTSLAGVMKEQGAFGDALALLEPIVRAARTDAPEAASARLSYGHLLHVMGRLDAAEDETVAALDWFRVNRGSGGDTANALASLGAIYAERGQSEQAARLETEALEMLESSCGPDHPDTVALRGQMGNSALLRGDLERAETLARAAMAWNDNRRGTSSPPSLSLRMTLGRILLERAELAAASSMFEAVRSNAASRFPPDHPLLRSAMHNLGVVSLRRGDVDGAARWFEAALEGRSADLTTAHPSVLESLAALASVRLRQGARDEARKLAHDVLREQRARLGDEHPQTLNTANKYAVILRRCGEPDAAEEVYVDTLHRMRGLFRDEDPRTLMTIHNLGRLHLERHDPDRDDLTQAEALFREATEGRSRALGPEHVLTLESSFSLAWTLVQRAKLGEAIPMLREIATAYERRVGRDHPDTHNVVSGLAFTLLRSGRPSDAVPLLIPTANGTHARPSQRSQAIEALIAAYDTMHRAEPDGPHGDQAAAWRERKRQNLKKK